MFRYSESSSLHQLSTTHPTPSQSCCTLTHADRPQRNTSLSQVNHTQYGPLCCTGTHAALSSPAEDCLIQSECFHRECLAQTPAFIYQQTLAVSSSRRVEYRYCFRSLSSHCDLWGKQKPLSYAVLEAMGLPIHSAL